DLCMDVDAVERILSLVRDAGNQGGEWANGFGRGALCRAAMHAGPAAEKAGAKCSAVACTDERSDRDARDAVRRSTHPQLGLCDGGKLRLVLFEKRLESFGAKELCEWWCGATARGAHTKERPGGVVGEHDMEIAICHHHSIGERIEDRALEVFLADQLREER